LSFGVPSVGTVGVRVEELAQGEPVGGFSCRDLGMSSQR
jgi:hypothetical protein